MSRQTNKFGLKFNYVETSIDLNLKVSFKLYFKETLTVKKEFVYVKWVENEIKINNVIQACREKKRRKKKHKIYKVKGSEKLKKMKLK